ncbi:MAG: hypothetical protein AAF430_14350 [Myxococcota bacterium]
MASKHDSVRPPVAVHAAADAQPAVSKAKQLFLLAAGLSFLASISLFFTGDHERGIFVGIWVPSILSMGTLLLGAENRD